LWLAQNALAEAPVGSRDLPALIARLGLVQLDSIPVVARAHDHILWSRCQSYRPAMLDGLLDRREVFEHFTHDASILPIALFPFWTRQFRRRREGMERSDWWRRQLPPPDELAALRDRIAAEGPLSSTDFDSGGTRPTEMWHRPAHKAGLDFLWHAGELATHSRPNFRKVYDLTERVIPARWRDTEVPDAHQVAALCTGALDRLGVATPGEVQRFWAACDPAEVRAWLEGSGAVDVEVEGADGSWRAAHAVPDIESRLAAAPAPTSRLRILNPFDPAVRDRARLLRLFGFDYRNEIFVPAAQRVWGYYVMPLLEGDRFVGRIEASADRRAGALTALRLWPEPGVRWTPARADRLEAELSRLARLAGCERAAPCLPASAV
nr:winged helix DNA-binding domain-containing protein [Paracoccaceae bacterium]